ncbi:hypothetical protein GCM10010522_60580 [Kribbella solani]
MTKLKPTSARNPSGCPPPLTPDSTLTKELLMTVTLTIAAVAVVLLLGTCSVVVLRRRSRG